MLLQRNTLLCNFREMERRRNKTRGPDGPEALTSPDLLNNVKIGQDRLRLIMQHILFYGGYGHFG